MQRYFALDKKNDYFILESSDLHHISNVMRMRNGEFIEVVFDNTLYKCKVLFDNTGLSLRFLFSFSNSLYLRCSKLYIFFCSYPASRNKNFFIFILFF